jgi:hypothetical protein
VTLTYVFCLVRSARKPRLPVSPPGLPAVRALDAGDRLWLIVATVPASEFDEAALARGLSDLDWVAPHALRHEAVVEHFLPATALLPMQLFTLFKADDRALAHVRAERPRLNRILSRIERQLEWGLRVTFDEYGARQSVESRYAAASSGAPGTGSSYLARKRDLFDVTRVQLAAARAEAGRLHRTMARIATDARRRTATEQATPGSRLLLDAAYLVPVARTASFRAVLRQNARKLGTAGMVAVLTGPWPPYNFIAPASPGKNAARPAVRPKARKTR